MLPVLKDNKVPQERKDNKVIPVLVLQGHRVYKAKLDFLGRQGRKALPASG